MKAGYIDTSFLLSIVFEDENYTLSVETWNSLDVHLSSVLLDIECRINIHKYCISLTKDRALYRKTEKLLSWHLSGIHRKNADRDIFLEIQNVDKLKELKSLDSIHLATANIFNALAGKELLLCSYDKKMNKVASSMGLTTLKGYRDY